MQYCMVFLQGLGALWLVRIPGNQRLLVFVPYLLFQIVYAVIVLRRASRQGIPFWRPAVPSVTRGNPPAAEDSTSGLR
jgi:hypothetical protein